jgi:hypothetical protein
MGVSGSVSISARALLDYSRELHNEVDQTASISIEELDALLELVQVLREIRAWEPWDLRVRGILSDGSDLLWLRDKIDRALKLVGETR